jgi:hypothetical protein
MTVAVAGLSGGLGRLRLIADRQGDKEKGRKGEE